MDHLIYPFRQSLKNSPAANRSSSDQQTTREELQYHTADAGDTPLVVVPTHNDPATADRLLVS